MKQPWKKKCKSSFCIGCPECSGERAILVWFYIIGMCYDWRDMDSHLVPAFGACSNDGRDPDNSSFHLHHRCDSSRHFRNNNGSRYKRVLNSVTELLCYKMLLASLSVQLHIDTANNCTSFHLHHRCDSSRHIRTNNGPR